MFQITKHHQTNFKCSERFHATKPSHDCFLSSAFLTPGRSVPSERSVAMDGTCLWRLRFLMDFEKAQVRWASICQQTIFPWDNWQVKLCLVWPIRVALHSTQPQAGTLLCSCTIKRMIFFSDQLRVKICVQMCGQNFELEVHMIRFFFPTKNSKNGNPTRCKHHPSRATRFWPRPVFAGTWHLKIGCYNGTHFTKHVPSGHALKLFPFRLLWRCDFHTAHQKVLIEVHNLWNAVQFDLGIGWRIYNV